MRFLYLLVIFIPFSLFAQQKGWQEITISDGLSQGMIFDLKQDQKGFIWVATKDGLNRYDGHNFMVFTHDPYDTYSLSDNNCSTLLIDSRGWLWVGTLNQGLNLFDTHTQRFFHLDIRDQASPKAGNYEINGISEDPEGNIWVTANLDKLFKITLSSALKTSFPDQPNLADRVQIIQASIIGTAVKSINHLSFRSDGQAMAVCDDGICTFNWHYPGKAGTVNPVTKELSGVVTMYGNASQDAWLGTTDHSIVFYRRGSLKTVPLPKKKYETISLKAVDATTLAIAADELLWLMSPDELFSQDSLTARNAFTILPANIYAITNMIKDQTGNIWVGTSGYGLRKFNPKIKQFHSLLPNTTFSYLYADQQARIYMRHQFTYYQLDRFNNRMVPFLDADLPPADKRQRYMMQDRTGTFWVSNTNFETHDMSVFKFSTDWKLLKKYPLPPNTSFGFYGNYTVEDKVGRLWIGATNGKLLRFDPQTEAYQTFSYQSLLPQKGADIETYFLHFDRAGTLWMATQQGLIRADHLMETPRFSIYKNSQRDRQSLSNDYVLSLLDDPYEPDRYLWVGTKGGGLDRLDKQTGHFSHITEAQGLPNKVVYGILTDTFKNLWLSTNRGLAQFNPKTRTFHNYTKADGLQDDEFNTGSFIKTPSGELVFGGVNGLTAFRASEFVAVSTYKPLANIIGLKINNEPIRVGGNDGILANAIEFTQRLDLSHTQNLLTLEVGVMDYTNSARNRYRYRLEGIDADWVEAGTNRFANYAQLPDGNYTFVVMGSRDGDVWSKPVELQIRVHPPFYRTWWAYLLYVLILGVIGWQLSRFQTQRLLLQQQVAFEQQEASRLAELDTMKTQFFTNISHEFRTPLTLILGPLTDLKQRFPAEPMLGLMERNGKRLLSLINQLLDLSKLEAGQLKAETGNGDIAAFFRTLTSSFSSLAESRQIQFTFVQNVTERWADFDRDKLEKIVTNLLSNAFKFTPAGRAVSMRVQYPENKLMLTVKDTGIGIAPANLAHIFERFYQVDEQSNRPYEGTGIGLALVNELVKVLDGTIQVVSAEGVGTTFTVTLPLIKSTTFAPASRSARRGPVFTQAEEMAAKASIASLQLNPNPWPAGTQAKDTPTTEQEIQEKILLIIDDNADIRAYIRSIFEPDYRIIEAEDGQDGLEKATQNLPDIVICDLMMPRLDGFGFCRAMKTQEATSHIPVVMLTAKATIEDRIEGLELGADEYLTKPFDRAEIQVRLRNLINKQERLQRYYSTRIGSVEPKPALPQPETLEDAFLQKARKIAEQHLSDSRFSVEQFSEAMNLSPSQLLRKLKALTNLTVVEFLRHYRLHRAATLLAQGAGSVSAIAYQVGFESLPYFTKVFQEEFGVVPSAYSAA